MHPGLVLHRPQELQLPPQANPHPLHGALAPVGEAEPDTGGGEAEKAAAKLGMPPLLIGLFMGLGAAHVAYDLVLHVAFRRTTLLILPVTLTLP